MKDKIVILFIYGGGIRGIIPTRLIDHIERKTGYPITDLVDVFSGPSTGAIINSAMNIPDPHAPDKPRYRAKHIVRFYEQEGEKIFPLDRSRAFRGLIHDFNNRTMKLSQLNYLLRHGHYNPRNLYRPLKKLYGPTKLSESLKSLVIPAYNIDGEQITLASEADESEDSPVRTKNNFIDEGGHALWLKNIKFPDAIRIRSPQNVTLLDSVMASTAAPTYFPCYHFSTLDEPESQIHYSGIDGSIFDNPCISYLGAISPHLPDDKDVVFIALGTGYTHKSITKDEWNKLGSLGVVDPVNDLPLINILFHASESALLESFEAEITNNNLFVFNKSMNKLDSPDHAPSPEIDVATPENLKRLENFTNLILEEQEKQIDALCHTLVSLKNKREINNKSRSFFNNISKLFKP